MFCSYIVFATHLDIDYMYLEKGERPIYNLDRGFTKQCQKNRKKIINEAK